MTFIEQTKLQIIIMIYSRPGNIHLAKPEQDGLKTIYNNQLPPTYLSPQTSGHLLYEGSILKLFLLSNSEQKFVICVYQRPVTISKSISGCQTPVRNLLHPPKSKIRHERTQVFITPVSRRMTEKLIQKHWNVQDFLIRRVPIYILTLKYNVHYT